jgi:hypothetical protein
LTDSRRRRRPSVRERSRFGRASKGNRDVIRFRRNRELLVREITVLVLWIAVSVMLVNLAQTLLAVSKTHLAERAALLRHSLPFVPVLAAIFCIWRARLNIREIREIRAEQAEVKARMTAPDDEDVPGGD